MTLRRYCHLLFLAFALLLAQQEAAAHMVIHAAEQHKKHSSNSPACEKCQLYAELGSALHASTYSVAALGESAQPAWRVACTCPASPAPGAHARAPPGCLQ